MDPIIAIALTILFLPLAAFTVQILVGWRLPRQGDWLPTTAMFAALGLACYVFFGKVLLGGPHGMKPVNWSVDWLKVEALGYTLRIGFGVLVDNITGIMLFVVTLVSFLVHLYSTSYMRDHHGHPEDRYNRFFAFLGLFTFSMLLLILSRNLFMLYVAWELVGLCSYFLIGFYFQKMSAAHACMKAFVTNRVGDFGFFIGIMIVFAVTGTVDMLEVFDSVKQMAEGAGPWTPALLTAAGLCLFCGAVGKSAQFPLHVWLPDAMEGPTPVSALIHAATMVAAGVYMLARLFPVFAGPGYFVGDFFSSDALYVVAAIGSITAFGAATIALVQDDIKKVLAYSTVSQLGYMVLGVGVGSTPAALFHLFTHAFFKACLFLGAGSVIHAVHTNDMKLMGSLRKKMPYTYWTFLISTCAIAGVPFLSGFYSKEAILGQALAFGIYKGNVFAFLPFVLGILTAGITAFYMFRIIWMTFWGQPRDHHAYDHAHENPPAITIPLSVLGFLAIVAGGVLPAYQHWMADRVNADVIVGQALAEKYGRGWSPPLKADEHHASLLGLPVAHAQETAAPHGAPTPHVAEFHIPEPESMRPVRDPATGRLHDRAEHWKHAKHAAHYPVMAMSILMAFLGIFGSWFIFLGPLAGRDLIGRGPLSAYKRVLENLYYVDWFYSNVLLRAVAWIRTTFAGFDKKVIDGIVNLASRVLVFVSKICGVADYWGVDGTVRGTAGSVLKAGREARRVQTGQLQEYVYLTVVLLAFIFLVWIVAGTLL